MRQRRSALVCLLAAAVAVGTACSGPAPGPDAGSATGHAPASSAPPPSASPAPKPRLTGDAARNPACRLLDIAAIEQMVAAHVIEERGLTNPGSYARKGLSCTYILDSTDIGIPAVVVQWEHPVTTWHDPLVGLYRSTVQQRLAVKVPHLGDYAMIEGADAIVIAGTQSLRISVTVHPSPTRADQDHAVALLRLALSAAKAQS